MASKRDESESSSSTSGTSAGAGARSGMQSAEYESSSQRQLQEQELQTSRAIDRTKESVRRSIEEARREIPQYAQSVTDYHQQAMDSAEEISNNFLDSQKQVISSTQEMWSNYLDTVYWWMSPRKLAEMYTQSVSNFADNAVSASRIWNRAVLANMDASKAYLTRARESSRDISKINSNTAMTFERTAATGTSRSSGTDKERERTGGSGPRR